MKDVADQQIENEDDSLVLLDTLVSAHYLALQMRILRQGEIFNGREATEFLADALSEWARIVEVGLFAAHDPYAAAVAGFKQH